jgi:CRISPR-associated endonuclease Cas2
MYVIVTYDLPVNERKEVYQMLNQRLSRLQNSVFAGEMSRQETKELISDLRAFMNSGSCLVWVLDRYVEPHLIGQQIDREDNFL